MSDRFLLIFLSLLLSLFSITQASAQKVPQAPVQVQPPAVQEDEGAKPEPPKITLNVEIKENLLSVEIENVNFGAAIRAVAEKAGFKIEGSGEVFTRKLNTKFTDIEVERGVLRLLTLVKENNYMLHYDDKGMISRLEILGGGAGKAPSVTSRQPMRPAPIVRQPSPAPAAPDSTQIQRPGAVTPVPQTRSVPPVLRRRPVPARPMPSAQPAVQPSVTAKPQPEEGDDDDEESVDETPYVAPQSRPAPAPVKKP